MMSSSHEIENPSGDFGGITKDGIENSCDQHSKRVSNDSSSPHRSIRQRVLKEVGITSTTFIGPVFPPNKAKVKSKIDASLSEFYRELEKIDGPDGAYDKPGKRDSGFVQTPIPPTTSTSKVTVDDREEKTFNFARIDSYQSSIGHKRQSWPHWYQNDPYQARRLRPGMEQKPVRAVGIESQWHHPQAPKIPPNPRFNRPAFRPPPALHPHDPPTHANQNWNGSGMTNQYRAESHFPKFSNFSSLDVHWHRSQGIYGESPPHIDRNEWSHSDDALTDNVNVGWTRDRDGDGEQCYQGEEYDRLQRYDSENRQWEPHYHPPDDNNTYNISDSSFVLILLRGLPGSGKSTLARELLSTGPSGVIMSTDDYFDHRDGYCYEPALLGEAHEWNQRRAVEAMHDGRSPIIIDNTNIQAWEMKPYVRMALENGYKVDFCEPDNGWKFDPYELEKRNKHGVPQEKIAQMLDHFSFPISVDIVMSSEQPIHVSQRHRPEQAQMTRRKQDFY